MLRFILVIAFHLPWLFQFSRMTKKAKKNNYSREEKYQVAKKIVKTIANKSRAKVEVTGKENLPDKNGYVLFLNHQGRFDGIAIVNAHDEPVSILIDEKRSHGLVAEGFLDLIESIRIEKDNPRSAIQSIKELGERVEKGQNFAIFPEGIYYDNKNNLLEFHTGCMHFLKDAKCDIIPTCLYDTYKVYNVNSLKKVKCSVNYLKSIKYDEYKDLSLKEIADLIKNRIQEKIDELNENSLTK